MTRDLDPGWTALVCEPLAQGKEPLSVQIDTVARELKMRRSVYPRLVAKHVMDGVDAMLETSAMEAVFRTLMWIEENQVEIKTWMAAKKSQAAA